MDMVDHAQALEAMQRDAALAGHRTAPALSESATHCASCGERIPLARRRAVPGAQRCVPCQTIFERRARAGGE